MSEDLWGKTIRNFVDNSRHGGRVALLAWGTCTLTLVLISGSLVLASLGTAGVGGLVASRRPENPVGLFFLAGSLIGALQALCGSTGCS